MQKQKTVTTSLQVKSPDLSLSCSTSKSYSDTFKLVQEVTTVDAFLNILSASKSAAILSAHNTKALVIKNVGNVTAEILMEVMAWKDDSSVDARNNNDLGLTTARDKRYWSTILPVGEFIYLPTGRTLAYEETVAGTIMSAANAPVGTIAILPSAINSGNEYKQVKEISGTDYGEGTAVVVNEGSGIALTVTALTVDDGHWFKTGDLLFLGNNEIVRVLSVSGAVLTIERGLLGTDAAAVANDAVINYYFGNEYLLSDNGKCQTDPFGRFKQSGAFFGYARTGDDIASGLVPGSVAIGPFYTEGGYVDFGMFGISPGTEHGLVGGTEYSFTLVVDDYADGLNNVTNKAEIKFTPDSSDTTFATGKNSLIPKIQAALDLQYRTRASALYQIGATVGIYNGDLRISSASNHSGTCIGVNVTTTVTSVWGVGRFPGAGSNTPAVKGAKRLTSTNIVKYGPLGRLADETIEDPVTAKIVTNVDAFLFDDGNGSLRHNGIVVGSIAYETGHCEFTHVPNAEFKIYGRSHSAHSGGTSFVLNGYNGIQSISARSVNDVDNAKIELNVLA